MHGRYGNLRSKDMRAISFRTAYEKYSEGPYPLHLIPVLVTGIQRRRVCGAGESFQPNDLVWLDSCDRHRNEGAAEMHGQ
ncbi:hypothetical protein [Sinorhizobium meliloti]|uniref:hypothetical protein n=1 Tax=Rhizobium meliloti TaxID=382 RepID=UPI0018658C38|nr:hypothetical protein [Sinorhizobium meliloti]